MMGIGQRIAGAAANFDDMLANQAEQRANEARIRAIDDIKASMIKNPGDQAYEPYYPDARMTMSGGAEKYAQQYLDAATAMRDDQGYGGMSIEGINRAMNEDAAARYGYGALAIGGATAGGAAMTAGAQKLLGLMGILQEAGETEVAREMPLQS